jgi:prepilin-type N-terminal cleavage/methylation domain-containing protein/prepilin-type processing-associated H-X9-DG protein
MSLSDKKYRGFTLVELLVVIGIIALLISILLPSLNKARQASSQVVCQSNMRQFGIGIEMYVAINKGMMPQKGPDGSNTTTNFFGPSGNVIGFDDPSLWFNAIPAAVSGKSFYQQLVEDAKGNPLPAVGGKSTLLLCPMAITPGTQGTNDVVTADGNYFLLNGIDSTGVVPGNQFKFNASYVYNSKFTDTIAGGSGPAALKLSKLRPAAFVVTMVEKMANTGEYRDKTVQSYATQYPTVYGSKINAQGLNNNAGQPKSNWKRFTTRHRSGGNLLFADGHVQWFSWTDTQIQPNQMPYNANTSDANQYNRMIWSVYGPIN